MEFTIPVGLFQKLIKNYMMFQPHFSVRLLCYIIFVYIGALAAFDGIISTLPSGSPESPFAEAISASVVPYFLAISQSVSPFDG